MQRHSIGALWTATQFRTMGANEQMTLNDTEKHRVIYKFLPTLRGHLLEGDDLEQFYADAIRRAQRRGWSERNLEAAAKSGKWRKEVLPSPGSFG
jgi:hypothetical protein